MINWEVKVPYDEECAKSCVWLPNSLCREVICHLHLNKPSSNKLGTTTSRARFECHHISALFGNDKLLDLIMVQSRSTYAQGTKVDGHQEDNPEQHNDPPASGSNNLGKQSTTIRLLIALKFINKIGL